MESTYRPCPWCEKELAFLETNFAKKDVEIYIARFGIKDGRRRSWQEIEDLFNCYQEVAFTICDDIVQWLNEHSPFRPLLTAFRQDPHCVQLERAGMGERV